MLSIFKRMRKSSVSFFRSFINLECVSYIEVCKLIEDGANVRELDERMRTPLHMFIAANSDISILEKLIECGADVNAQDKWGCTPLLVAAHSHKDERVITLLLDHDADINHKDIDKGFNAIQHACWNSNEKVMEALIRNGGKVYGDLMYNLSLAGLCKQNPNPKVGKILTASSLKEMLK